MKRCSQRARWVHAVLAPYLDRYLRVQTPVVHLPVLPVIRPETDAASECSLTQDLVPMDETVCVA